MTLPSPLQLLLGDEELLVSRAVSRLIAAAREHDPAATVHDLAADAVEEGRLPELLSPSLFAETTVLVVRGAQDLDEAARDALAAYVADPDPATLLVIAHSGVTKGKRLLDALRAAGAVLTECAKLTKPAERFEFVQQEVRAGGRSITAGASRALVDAVGHDLRELSSAATQLIADTDGDGLIDEAVIARYHRGRAETTGFQIADSAVAGNAGAALSLLRAALDAGTPELLVVSALAGSLREIGLVRGAGRGGTNALAKQLGMPPWKVEKAQRSGSRWTDEGLARAIGAVAEADIAVKGGSVSSGYALERAVVAVAAAHG